MVKKPNIPDKAGISTTPAAENPSRNSSTAYPKYMTTQLSSDISMPPPSYRRQ